MTRISVSALALAISVAAAPQLFAQGRTKVFVCRDGQVMSTRRGATVCERHGGVDGRATAQARRNGVNTANGIYGPNGVYNPNGGRGVYNGNGTVYPSTGSNRSVYGNAYPNGSNRTVYGTVNPNPNGRVHRDDDDRDDDRSLNPGNNGRGHAFGHFKNKHHKHGDGDNDDQ